MTGKSRSHMGNPGLNENLSVITKEAEIVGHIQGLLNKQKSNLPKAERHNPPDLFLYSAIAWDEIVDVLKTGSKGDGGQIFAFATFLGQIMASAFKRINQED